VRGQRQPANVENSRKQECPIEGSFSFSRAMCTSTSAAGGLVRRSIRSIRLTTWIENEIGRERRRRDGRSLREAAVVGLRPPRLELPTKHGETPRQSFVLVPESTRFVAEDVYLKFSRYSRPLRIRDVPLNFSYQPNNWSNLIAVYSFNGTAIRRSLLSAFLRSGHSNISNIVKLKGCLRPLEAIDGASVKRQVRQCLHVPHTYQSFPQGDD